MLGLSDLENEGFFTWINVEVPTYLNWAEGEPNNDTAGMAVDQDCAHMLIDGT